MSLSSTQTRAAGKGGKEKATKISQNTKQISDNTKPQATAEQIRIAQLIGDGKHADADPELQAKVTQVMELTGRSSDDAMVALHDCDNDPNLAVDMLLEGNQQQGEWELSGKKKKNRQPVPVSKSTNVETVKNGSSGPVSNKENRNGRNDRHRENGKDRENSRSRGPPRLNRGKGWRGRETEKNEKNLEESGPRLNSGPPRGGRAMNNSGRGRGNRIGGPRSRTFENKSAQKDGFPRSIDTWTNSTAEQADNTSSGNEPTMTVGNWSDFQPTEDWNDDIEDWSENLKETKVFTPSGTSTAQTVASNSINSTVPESIDLVSLLQKPSTNPNLENTSVLSQASQNTFHSQYQQKATETIKSVVCVGNVINTSTTTLPNSQQNSNFPVGQSLPYRSDVNAGQQGLTSSTQQKLPCSVQQPPQRIPSQVPSTQQALPQRSKPQRTRVPPPSKIPSSAVEMPDDTIGSLDVQFGGLEFGTESPGFDFTSGTDSSVNHYSSSVSSAPTLSNQLTNAGPQSVLSNSADVYNVTTTDLTSGSNITSSAQSKLNHLSQTSLGQSPKMNSNADSLLISQNADTSSTYVAPRTSQPPGLDVNLGGNKTESSSALSGYGTSTANVLHQNNNLSYQSSYKNNSSLSASNGSNNCSSSTQKPYSQPNNPSYAQSSTNMSSAYSVNQQDPSVLTVYSGSDQTSNYQPQYQSSGFQSVSSYPSATINSYGTSPKLTGTLSTDASSLNQSTQNSYESTVPGSTVNLTTGSSTLSNSGGNSSVAVCSSAVSLSGNSISVTALGLSNSSVVTTTVASGSTGMKSSLSSGKTMPNLPPGVPAVLGHQFIMSQAGLPFYALQQPAASGYTYEELLMQSRLPPLASYYDVPFQQQTSLTTGREGSLSSVPYSGNEGKYSRGDSNSSPIPTSLSQQQQSSSQHQQQQFINHAAAALPPGYGNYYYVGMPGSFPSYSPLYPVPPVTNAHGATSNTQFQKPGTYGSHTYNSGYDNLGQPQDYSKGAYGAGAQSQNKGVTGVSSGVSVGGSSAGSDMSGSIYNKNHNLGKSQFDKPGFHAGTPPPFNLAGGVTAGAGHQTGGGPMGGAPSGPYATPTASYVPMMPQHHMPAMLHNHNLQQDATSTQRAGQNSSQQKGNASSSKGYANSYWGSN